MVKRLLARVAREESESVTRTYLSPASSWPELRSRFLIRGRTSSRFGSTSKSCGKMPRKRVSLDSIFGSLQYKYRLVDKFKVRGTVEPKPPRIYQLVNRSPFTYSLKHAARIFLVYARLIGAVERKSHFSKRTP